MNAKRQELIEEALLNIINARNEYSEPCHYKIRQAIDAAQRMLTDTDEDDADASDRFLATPPA